MKRFSPGLFAFGFALGAIGAAAILAANTYASPARASSRSVATQTPDQVIQWNRILLGIVRTPGVQPATVHATRSFAIMHAAVYDAVNAIVRTHSDYLIHLKAPRHASVAAAAATAAHDSLVQLYPSQAALLDADLATSLASIPDGQAKSQGIEVGASAAAQIVALRSNDGSSASPIPFVPGTNPGDYQLTPPAFAQPVFTHWPFVQPFVLRSARQFRPGPPPAPTSSTYTTAFDEVHEPRRRSTARPEPPTRRRSQVLGRPIQTHWNEIAQTTASSTATRCRRTRAVALLDRRWPTGDRLLRREVHVTIALVAVTAIGAEGAADGRRWRPRPIADSSHPHSDSPRRRAGSRWTPLATTALDPSDPGAHAVVSAAGADVLGVLLPRRSGTASRSPPRCRRESSGRSRASRPPPMRRATAASTRASISASTRLQASVSDIRSPTTSCGTS